jgi:hypothetical protein
MARLRVSSNLRQNERRFYLCQAYSQSSRPCPFEADWVRRIYGEPTYLCERHNQVLDQANASALAA